MSRQIKFELIAQPEAAADALLGFERGKGDFARLLKLAKDLVPEARYDAVLSYDWNCTVICTEEFSAWWRGRERPPQSRIFLEVAA